MKEKPRYEFINGKFKKVCSNNEKISSEYVNAPYSSTGFILVESLKDIDKRVLCLLKHRRKLQNQMQRPISVSMEINDYCIQFEFNEKFKGFL